MEVEIAKSEDGVESELGAVPASNALIATFGTEIRYERICEAG
jgi:hypothetical protein